MDNAQSYNQDNRRISTSFSAKVHEIEEPRATCNLLFDKEWQCSVVHQEGYHEETRHKICSAL